MTGVGADGVSTRLRLADDLDSTGEGSPREPIGVVLADRHPGIRRSLRALLDHELPIEVLAEATDLPGVESHARNHLPTVLVLDLDMTDGASAKTIQWLRRELPGTAIVALSMEENPATARQAIDAGALAFVLKHHAESELAPAVRAAAQGDEYVSPRVAPALEGLERAMARGGLTLRETEVLRLLALGYTSVEIGRHLHLSPRTVETHRARIQRKLKLRTRSELVRYALDSDLIGATSSSGRWARTSVPPGPDSSSIVPPAR